jgi:putative heme-binding domain-containing protein
LLGHTSDISEKVVIFKQLNINDLSEYPKLEVELHQLLADVGDTDFLDLVSKYSISSESNRLLTLIRTSKEGRDIQQGARMFIDMYGMDAVKKLMNDQNKEDALNAIERFGLVDETPVTNQLIEIFNNENKDLEIRQMAMEAMNGWRSEEILWDLIQKGKVSEGVMDIAKRHMLATWHNDIRAKANEFFDDGTESDIDVKALLAKTGNAGKGQKVFEMYCKTCHLVNGTGVDFGPGLSQIGGKLSKEGLYNAILNPSEGMGFGYETQQIIMNDGTEIQAIITSKTENEVNVKLLGQAEQTRYPLSEVKSIKQLNSSLMPQFPLEEDQLVDLVEYLSRLK